MDIDELRGKEGTPILFVPARAKGDKNSKFCEKGIIERIYFKKGIVRVKFEYGSNNVNPKNLEFYE